ncbi:MAG: hypothetical protein KKF46_02785 [Nanoarchaeota archaeon]|nr:hypothetical protein [Nanoarchaeota archaeon]MBU1321258.1 hypothetical protein [Nanoarchaeota archaeon]MBU1597329.1 hypothetical protein [Nanoarchaeota archaeon]MBU2441452.1 hypothetical protein [Nanoarchaeota archaeon]
MRCIGIFLFTILSILVISGCQYSIPENIPKEEFFSENINLRLELVENEPLFKQVEKIKPDSIITLKAKILGIESEDALAGKLRVGETIEINAGNMQEFFDCWQDECTFNQQYFDNSGLAGLQPEDRFRLAVILFSFDKNFKEFEIRGI